MDFVLDPFWIFGLGMELLLIGYGIYLITRLRKWRRLRKKVSDREALAWAKVINDPDCPSRPTKDMIEKMRRKLEK